jgi:hypothetical protein
LGLCAKSKSYSVICAFKKMRGAVVKTAPQALFAMAGAAAGHNIPWNNRLLAQFNGADVKFLLLLLMIRRKIRETANDSGDWGRLLRC